MAMKRIKKNVYNGLRKNQGNVPEITAETVGLSPKGVQNVSDNIEVEVCHIHIDSSIEFGHRLRGLSKLYDA